MNRQPEDITSIIQGLRGGDKSMIDLLMRLVYRELRRIAGRMMDSERADHTLSPTALINEAYIKLVGGSQISVTDRAHFIAIASRVMKRILIDYARYQAAEKRGGGQMAVTFDEARHVRPVGPEGLLQLDVALEQLRRENARCAAVIEYGFFGGLTHKEIAEVLRVSVWTVRRDWRLGRAWLATRLRT